MRNSENLTQENEMDPGDKVPDFSLLSHDIQSAVSDVIGGVRLVNHEGLPPEAVLQLERVRTAAELLARLVENALTAPGETGRDDVGLTNLNLHRYLDNLQSRWRGRAVEKGLGFHMDVPEVFPSVIHVNRMVLDRILTNVLSNAMKFCDSGTITMRLDLDSAKQLIFSIYDEGTGFNDTALANLFKRAARPKNATLPGQGLGLFIAHDLTVQMGAKIDFKNRSIRGSKVTLTLPHAIWSDPSISPAEHITSDLSGMKILVAEDSQTLQMVVAQMLQKLGAEFEMASDGVEAINWLQRENFDLVLLDIEMPNMSGIDVLHSVRKMPKPLADIPMIALTAFVLNSHREAIYAAGADGIIAKPLTRTEGFGAAILRIYTAQNSTYEETPDPETSEVVSRDQLAQLLDFTEPDTRAELLRRILSDLSETCRRITRESKLLNRSAIRAQTHILIALAGAIGAVSLQKASESLNQFAAKGSDDEVAEQSAICITLLHKVIEVVREKTKENADG